MRAIMTRADWKFPLTAGKFERSGGSPMRWLRKAACRTGRRVPDQRHRRRQVVDSISISGASPGQYVEKREEVSVKLYLVEQFACDILRKFGNAGVESSRFSPGVPWNWIGGAVPGIRSLD